jgi:hypothetical protein
MAELNQMTQEQLKYLRQKWSSEITELNREFIRAQKKLEKRVEKQEIDQGELELLASDLESANTILAHLRNTNASPEIIAVQEETVEKINQKYLDESSGLNIMTPEEVQLQKLLIEEIQQKRVLRDSRLTELNTLITG